MVRMQEKSRTSLLLVRLYQISFKNDNIKYMKQIIATLIFIAFFTLGGFGMFAMTGMEGHHHRPGCPFMPGEQIICNMTALDHIAAWQNAFTTTISTFSIYLLLVAVVLLVWKYYSPTDIFVRRLLLSRTREPVLVSLYQELFSSGILNPKAP